MGGLFVFACWRVGCEKGEEKKDFVFFFCFLKKGGGGGGGEQLSLLCRPDFM